MLCSMENKHLRFLTILWVFCSAFSLNGVQVVRGDLFQNLDFDDGTIPSDTYSGSTVSISTALPGWNWGKVGGASDIQWVAYDTISLDAPTVSIHDSESTILQPFSAYDLNNSYSIMLQTGSPFCDNMPVYIYQVGDLSSVARSIRFSTDWNWGGNLVLTLNGTEIPYHLYSTIPGGSNGREVLTYAADIRAFTGQENVELKFELSQIPGWYTTFGAQYSLDNIVFSPKIVPEPSSLILLATSAIGLLISMWRCRRKR
jgi:hypothetical protein